MTLNDILNKVKIATPQCINHDCFINSVCDIKQYYDVCGTFHKAVYNNYGLLNDLMTNYKKMWERK